MISLTLIILYNAYGSDQITNTISFCGLWLYQSKVWI